MARSGLSVSVNVLAAKASGWKGMEAETLMGRRKRERNEGMLKAMVGKRISTATTRRMLLVLSCSLAVDLWYVLIQ